MKLLTEEKNYFIMYLCKKIILLCVCECAAQEKKEDVRSPEVELQKVYELLDVGTENSTPVL